MIFITIMKIHDLKEFAVVEEQRLLRRANITEKKDLTYPQMIKLTEEVGELAEAILKENSLQRKDKQNDKTISVPDELADVVLVSFLLAENLGINMETALQKKIEKIKARNY